jgi:hypothetical protein
MNTDNDPYVDELIGNVLENNVPADVDRRLRSELESFRHRLGEVNQPAAHRSMTLSRRVWFGVSAAAAATVAVAALIWWSLVPSVSLADVAAAVLKQPWIHVQGTDPFGKKNEFWYSPVKDVSAWHDNEWIEYRDHRLRLYYAYDLHDKILYRVPEEMRRSMEHFASLIASLRVLFQSKQPVDNPLERLGFLGDEQTRYEVVKQEFAKVKQDGREWLDYHLTVREHGKNPSELIQLQVLFRVDPTTKLLRLVRYEYDGKGQHVVTEKGFDYPDKGPADVYDLGVPKTAKLVDRVPRNELARILETIRAGRERMDDYRAVFVRGREVSFSGSSPMVIYRKGDKFRADRPALFVDLWKVKAPKADEDMGAWWRDRVKHMVFAPIYINHGPTEYRVKTQGVTDPDGSEHVAIAGVEKHKYNEKPGETYPAYWGWMPEFACRPPLGIPHETMEPVLETNPREGPAGTILLRVRNIDRRKLPPVRNIAGELLPPPPDAYRNWLDPTRDYAVVRHDMIGVDGSGKETVTHSTIIEDMARSPQGTWYATRIRTKSQGPDGKTLDETLYLYVDFNVNLPDSFFEPPALGRIR